MTKDAVLREYKIEDIEQVVEVVMRVLPTLPNYKGIRPSAERIRYLLNNNRTNATFMLNVLVDAKDDRKVVGGIAGYTHIPFFARDPMASDTFLYVEPEYRTLRHAEMLIKSYTEWARARGAVLITGSYTSGYNDSGMDALLKRLGFSEVGKLYHWLDGVTHNGESR